MLAWVCLFPVLGAIVVWLVARIRPVLANQLACLCAWSVVLQVASLLEGFSGAAIGGVAHRQAIGWGMSFGLDGLSLAAMAGISVVAAMAMHHNPASEGPKRGAWARGGVLLLLGLGLALAVSRDVISWLVLVNFVPWILLLATRTVDARGSTGPVIRRLCLRLSAAAALQSFALLLCTVDGFNAFGGSYQFDFDVLASVALPSASGTLAFFAILLGGWLAAGLWPLDRGFSELMRRSDARTAAIVGAGVRAMGMVALVRLLPLVPTQQLIWSPYLGWIVGAGMIVASARAFATSDAPQAHTSLAQLSTLSFGWMALGVLTATMHGVIGALLGLVVHAWAVGGLLISRGRRTTLIVFAICAASLPGVASGAADFLIVVGGSQFGATAIPDIGVLVVLGLVSAAVGGLALGRWVYAQLRQPRLSRGTAWWALPALVAMLWVGWWPQWSLVRLAQVAHPFVNRVYIHTCHALVAPSPKASVVPDTPVQGCENPYPPVQAWARGGQP